MRHAFSFTTLAIALAGCAAVLGIGDDYELHPAKNANDAASTSDGDTTLDGASAMDGAPSGADGGAPSDGGVDACARGCLGGACVSGVCKEVVWYEGPSPTGLAVWK